MAQFEIKATLTSDKKLIFENGVPQNSGEHTTTSLSVLIPSIFSSFDFYLEFSCPQGKKYISPKLVRNVFDAENFLVEYQIENILLQNEGLVLVQLVARAVNDNRVVFRSQKSGQSSFFVTASIVSDSETMRINDYFTETVERVEDAEKLIADASGKVQKLLEEANTKIADIDAACLKAFSVTEELQSAAVRGDFDGKNATIAVGEVVSSDAETATVKNSGTEINAVFDFALPRGKKGEQGEKGDRGEKGEKGDKGETGLAGLSPTVSVGTVQTGAAGANAEVFNSGTPDNVVLNFTVPKGDAGTFAISKVFSSVAEMDAGFESDGVPPGALAVIETGNADDADNAKLFRKGEHSYEFLTDMSGSAGIQGPQGIQGDTGQIGPRGEKGETGERGFQGEK